MSCVLRHRVLLESEYLTVHARRYAPGTIFTPHRDDRSRITLTLEGAVAEDTRHGSCVLGIGDVLLKSRSAVHEDRYGPHGATQISFEFASEDVDGALTRVIENVWCVRRGANAFRHAVAALEAATARDRAAEHAATMDITAAIAGSVPVRSVPPQWLDALREELEETGLARVNVSERARQAGVHPVHASRLFRAHYGASITDHAQTHAVRRAVAEFVLGASLSEAAAAAGFYDQSHMNRIFQRVVRRTPGQCRSIYAPLLRSS